MQNKIFQKLAFFTGSIFILSGCSGQGQGQELKNEVLYVSVYDNSPMPLMDLVTIGVPKRNQNNQWVAILNDEKETRVLFSGYWIASPAAETNLLFAGRDENHPNADKTENAWER